MSAKEDIAKNDTKTVQVTVVIFYNGTYVVDPKDDPAVQIVEIAFLVIVFLVCFVSNIFLLVTIASSYTLRKVPFNILLANVSAVFLMECLVNMSVALFYVTVDTWKLEYVGCAISSFVVQLVTLEVSFSLCLMCAEGMVSVWQPFRFQSYLTIKKQVVVITTLWTAGILLCVPLLLKSITSRLFPSRFGCASAGDGFVHALFLTIWCYCLMIALGLGCLVSLGVRQYNEYRIQRKKTGVNYSDVFMQGDLWTEWVNFKLVAWLALFYLLLELPYIVVHQVSALKNYHADKKIFDNSTLITPLVEKTPKYETAFTWFRYIYSCLFALLVFKMRKDIRRKFRTLISCCERSVVRDHSAGPVIKQETKKNVNPVLPLSLNTPILYISPDGLCLRQLDPMTNTVDNSPPKFLSYLCDNSIVAEGFTVSADNSFNSGGNPERRFSKESEMTLPDMGSDYSGHQLLEEVPLKDIDAEIFEEEKILEPPPPKKSVRFADTLTIFRSMTPRSTTPQWVLSKNKAGGRKTSKIPTRVDKITPWKVEENNTYRVSTSDIESESIKKVVNFSESTTVKPSNKSKSNSKIGNKTRRKSKFSAPPPRWKIKKLSS